MSDFILSFFSLTTYAKYIPYAQDLSSIMSVHMPEQQPLLSILVIGTIFDIQLCIQDIVVRILIQNGGVETVVGKNIHVEKNGNIWQAKQENAQRSSGNFDTQQAAFERAREIARNKGQEVGLAFYHPRITPIERCEGLSSFLR